MLLLRETDKDFLKTLIKQNSSKVNYCFRIVPLSLFKIKETNKQTLSFDKTIKIKILIKKKISNDF